MTGLAGIAQMMNAELAAESSMKVGKTLTHPDGRKVKIKSGCFLDSTYGLLSNWWEWNEVLEDGSLGPEECGYGW